MSRSGLTLLLVLLVAAILAAVGLLLVLGAAGGVEIDPLAGDVVLEVDFTRGYAEYVPDDAITLALKGREPSLRDVVVALRRAAGDERVVGVLARVGAAPMGMATLQELRSALRPVRDAGKATVAWADTLGEWGPGNGAYYLATACEQIHLQPSGDVGLTGLRYEIPFLAGALDKLGVEAQIGKRHEYKNAPDTFTGEELSPAHEEAMAAIARSQFDQIVAGIAAGRGMTEPQVRALAERGPFLGGEALAAGLVDRLAYRDETVDELLREAGGAELLPLKRYLRRPGRARGTTVALIYGVGSVARGESRYDPLTGDTVFGSETVARAFRDAVEAADVEAILFRVDSPGGSYVASDTVWRETVRARDAGKPVVVSMGDVAGSGGYFVAMAADAIVAQPGTVTGSIGVYGGKFFTREGWRKLGITWDDVSTTGSAAIWSSVERYGPRDWERVDASLDRIYDDFVGKVAAGRDLPPERVGEIARGRIWSGADALEVGLVDALGGYPEAESLLRRELDLKEDAALTFRVFPRPKTPWELIVEGRSWIGGASWLRALRPVIELARSLGLVADDPQTLAMPEPPWPG